MLVEKRICDVDGKLMIYHENLKRLKKRLDILKQIHEAPQVYAKLVVEVVRRRKFSTQFLKVTTLLQYNFFYLGKTTILHFCNLHWLFVYSAWTDKVGAWTGKVFAMNHSKLFF